MSDEQLSNKEMMLAFFAACKEVKEFTQTYPKNTPTVFSTKEKTIQERIKFKAKFAEYKKNMEFLLDFYIKRSRIVYKRENRRKDAYFIDAYVIDDPFLKTSLYCLFLYWKAKLPIKSNAWLDFYNTYQSLRWGLPDNETKGILTKCLQFEEIILLDPSKQLNAYYLHKLSN